MEIYATKEYDKFKRVLGNRAVDKNHVARLTVAIGKQNLLDKFPIIVSKDNYLIDGQHRLEAAKANDWEIHVATIDMNLSQLTGNLVATLNSTQKYWKPIDYINFYMERGNEQYAFLKELMKAHHISAGNLITLCRGKTDLKTLRSGALYLYKTEEDKKICLELIEAYLEVRKVLEMQVYADRDFVLAFRYLMQKVDVQTLTRKIERYNKPITVQNNMKDYLRLFELILSSYTHGDKYVRLF